MSELIDVQVTLPAETKERIEYLAAQCGLTVEQMASAMFVLAIRDIPMQSEDNEPEETHL